MASATGGLESAWKDAYLGKLEISVKKVHMWLMFYNAIMHYKVCVKSISVKMCALSKIFAIYNYHIIIIKLSCICPLKYIELSTYIHLLHVYILNELGYNIHTKINFV